VKLGRIQQQPAERLSYTAHYGRALIKEDRIEWGLVCSDPHGLVIDSAVLYGDRVRFWVSGGEDRSRYRVTVTVGTKEGRVLQDEFTFLIKDV
jgi:hypothetical protein